MKLETRKKQKSCLVCGGRLDKVLLNITQPDRFEKAAGISGKYLRRWVECSACGTAVNIMAADVERALSKISSSYYKHEFKTGAMLKERFDKVMGFPPESSDNYHRVRRIEGFISRYRVAEKAKPALLDVGAGMGVFLSVFQKKNGSVWKACGMEPDPMAAQHLRSISKNRFSVTESMLEDHKPGRRKYRLCTLNKMLEHIKKPVDFLKKINRLLEDDGFVYVELPDKLTIGNRPSTDNILGALHHYLFGIMGMEILLNRAGFVPLSIEREFEPSEKISVYAFAAKAGAVKKLVGIKVKS